MFVLEKCVTPRLPQHKYCLFCPIGSRLVSDDLARTSQRVTHHGTTPAQARLTTKFQEPVMCVTPKRII